MKVDCLTIISVMPRGRFIGSFSTKRANFDRTDIEIVSLDPNMPLPRMRLMLHCDAAHVGHVIWQISILPNVWISQPGVPPYDASDLGVLGQPHAPIAIPLALAAGGGHSLYQANWAHHVQLTISPNWPNTWFKYQPPPRQQHGQQIIPPPMYFPRLRCIQQIQTATRAEDIL